MKLLVFSLLFVVIQSALGANILAFFPFPIPSHHNVFRPIVKALASRGHQVTYVSPFPSKVEDPNLKHIFVENKRDAILNRSITKMMNIPIIMMGMVTASVSTSFGEKMYSSEKVQEIIHSDEKYDAVLMSSMVLQDPVSTLAHKFNALAIEILPLGDLSWVNELSGLPDNCNYMLDFKSSLRKPIDQMTYWDRIHNAYILMTSYLSGMYTLYNMQSLADKYFNYTGWEGRPPISQLVANKSLILTNSHLSVGYSYPKAPHLKEIGGVNVRQPEPLPQNIQQFMDEAKDGVIYFSLGTVINASSETSQELRDDLVKVLSNVKQKVLWKWESDTPPSTSKNIMFSKFFPQVDILAHKNLKLFITHGGLLSMHEAVYHGVPLVCIPFIGDQPKNVNVVVSAKFGVRLDYLNLTETSFSWAINEVISNPVYASNAKTRSALFKDRPQKPLDEAIYWIEYVLRNGNALQPRAVYLPFYQLHNVDILLTFFIISCSIVILLKLILKKLLCRKTLKQVDLKKKKQ